jgi:Mn2+/Fe2+ NRAMP family transporter
MKKLLQIALGILAAIGGFVDIGDLVFNVEAGATFGYQLLWVVVVGVVGIIVYSEMCGRVAACSKRPVFDAVRERLGFGVGLGPADRVQFVNLMTLAAEIGGVALLSSSSRLSYRGLIVVAVVALGVSIWVLPFDWIERVFGYWGSACSCSWSRRSSCTRLGRCRARLRPALPTRATSCCTPTSRSVCSAPAMTPYEVYFYSSGVVEEGWTPKDLGLNRANSMIGYALGGVLSFALMITAGALYLPKSIEPQFIGTVALAADVPLGTIGLILALVGMLFAVGGAAIDTCLSGAYNVSQFFGWEWGKHRRAAAAPRFTLSWIVLLVLAFGVVMTGIDPICSPSTP